MDSSELLQAIVSSATDHAIIVCDASGAIRLWNQGAQRIFGYSAEETRGRNIDLLFTHEDRLAGVPALDQRIAREAGRADDLRWHERKDGSRFWADGVVSPVRDANGTVSGYIKILCDATEKKRSEEEIARLARIDALTGIANRAEFAARLGEMTAAAQRHGQLLILQLVDLDHFKDVNDQFGHAVGDALLQQVSLRMRAAVRETDFVARLGGDEFVVLQPDADCPEVGGTLADKLVQTLSRPFRIEGHEVLIGASIGISVFPKDATDADQLIRKADLALYKVKAESRNGYHYFTEQLDYRAHKKSRDVAQLQRAVRNRQFVLHYQPQIDPVSGRATGVEALLRCTDAVLARYPLDELITLASNAGLMRELGLWSFGEACAQARRWRDAGLAPLRICINLSPVELTNPQLPHQLDAMLARNGLKAGDIEVEVTERQLLGRNGQAGNILAELRARGVSVAIDDFGTGYSSLSYLANLPIDRIKLDRFFVESIPDDPQSCAIASAIVSLAHTLHLQIVVEGVESEAQAEFFRDERCEAMQGYFFSHPLAGDDITAWLSHQGSSAMPLAS